jgi:hypothetical protein
MRRVVSVLVMVAVVALVAGCSRKTKAPTAPVAPNPVTLMSYPANAGPGDGLTRGFYIPSFPGKSLATATLWFSGDVAGAHTFRLIARSGAFDGAVIDSAKTTVALPAGTGDSTRTTFTFSNKAVTQGSTVTFEITYISGPSTLNFYVVNGDYGGLTGAAINLVQTNTTAPPLSTFRRDGIAFKLTGLAP